MEQRYLLVYINSLGLPQRAEMIKGIEKAKAVYNAADTFTAGVVDAFVYKWDGVESYDMTPNEWTEFLS